MFREDDSAGVGKVSAGFLRFRLLLKEDWGMLFMRERAVKQVLKGGWIWLHLFS